MASTKVALIGRLTGPKGEVALEIVRRVLRRHPEVDFSVVGSPIDDRFTNAAPENVRFVGQVDDIASVISAQDLVVGAGRVALETMRLGVPVMAVGEKRYVGLIDAETIDEARATNFGDSDSVTDIDLDRLSADLARFVSGERRPDVSCYREYLKDYSSEHVAAQVMDVYRSAALDAYLRRFREIPILSYHRVLSEPPTGSRHNIYVLTSELDRQLDSIRRRGLETVTFRELLDGRRVRKPVILTFDDGYVDNHANLLPLLEKHRARAVIFCIGDRSLESNEWDARSGEPRVGLMNDDHLRACYSSGLVEIGSHGMTHSQLLRLSDEELDSELIESKRRLEAVLGDEVVSFAYPFGEHSEREQRRAVSAGYCFAVGTISGARNMVDDPFAIRRIPVFSNTDRFGFWRKTSGFYLRYKSAMGSAR